MSVASRILKNFALFIDGKGYAGEVENFKPPALTLAGVDYRAGGMDAQIFIPMGQEKMESTFNLTGYEPAVLSLWGVAANSVKQIVGRGAVESLDGTVEAVNITANVLIKSVEPDEWESGKKVGLKFMLSYRTYTYTQNGVVIHDIDIPNFKRIVNGVDQLAAQRAALGI